MPIQKLAAFANSTLEALRKKLFGAAEEVVPSPQQLPAPFASWNALDTPARCLLVSRMLDLPRRFQEAGIETLEDLQRTTKTSHQRRAEQRKNRSTPKITKATVLLAATKEIEEADANDLAERFSGWSADECRKDLDTARQLAIIHVQGGSAPRGGNANGKIKIPCAIDRYVEIRKSAPAVLLKVVEEERLRIAANARRSPLQRFLDRFPRRLLQDLLLATICVPLALTASETARGLTLAGWLLGLAPAIPKLLTRPLAFVLTWIYSMLVLELLLEELRRLLATLLQPSARSST